MTQDAVVRTGNMQIGYKFVGPMTMEEAADFCEKMRRKESPEIDHPPLVIIPLYLPDEARREIEERGDLMARTWLCIPRRHEEGGEA